MASQEHALRELRKGLRDDICYLLNAHENGIVSTKELRARYGDLSAEIGIIDLRLRSSIENSDYIAGPSVAVTAAPVSPLLQRMWDESSERRAYEAESPAILKFHRERDKQRRERDKHRQMDADYAIYREEFATTGDKGAFKKMLGCVYMT